MNIAWVAIINLDGQYTIGLAEQGIKGYSPLDRWNHITFPSYDSACKEAAQRNNHLGLTKDQALQIIGSTMF